MRRTGVLFLALLSFSLWAGGLALGRPRPQAPEISTSEADVDAIGSLDTNGPAKALQDTLWIANWTFDTGTPCSEEGWTHVDGHVLNDGAIHWHLETGFTTAAGMQGRSAAVGYHDDSCCANPDGYDNDWYQALRISYTGTATLSLDYIVDSESTFDFLQVETDSLCLSFARVDFDDNPIATPANFRKLEFAVDGLIPNGEWNAEPLTDFGPGTHCVYIAFFSDGAVSPCDGEQPTTVGEAAVIDNVVLVDGSGTRSEDFEDGSLDIGTFVNITDSKPFGTWARLYAHISDNDACTENTSCAWLWSDHKTPTRFQDPAMSFGPGGYVVRHYLDDIIVSPWATLSGTSAATATVLRFRRFPGNSFSSSRIVQNWSVRSRRLAGTQSCVESWRHASNWNSLSLFRWQTSSVDLSSWFDPAAEEIQIRFRTSDWLLIALNPPGPYMTGPGPYLDDVRIGRVILQGPVISEGIDARSQAQDCFPTEIHPGVTPAGEHHRPTTDRFGTCAFTQGTDLTRGRISTNLVTGDSIHVTVRGVRAGGEVVNTVTWHGAIVRGPHVSKAPAPYVVGPSGFFSVTADSVRSSAGTLLADNYFVDLDDTYFRGGDGLLYFWAATDAGGGFSTDPAGMSALPVSVPAAEAATGGLLEVSFLPTIDWAQDYVSRIASDTHGDLEPTPAELAASSQARCILYVNHVNARRRAGDANRTTFMYALDRLGYRDHYDVYDHTGMGNTNNHLGGRATVPQANGYALIVYDTGDHTPGRPLVPNGVNLDAEKVDQGGWFQLWLAQAVQSEPGVATLWLIGANLLEEHSTLPLYGSSMGVVLAGANQAIGLNPEVAGAAAFTFDRGGTPVSHDFTADAYVAQGGCPTIRTFDALGTTGTGVSTHRYRMPFIGDLDGAAIVMNSSPAEHWNTILQSHAIFDIRDLSGAPQSPPPELALVEAIFGATLPLGCVQTPTPTGTGGPEEIRAPLRTVLHQNVPNPFNPTTQIRFDLAQSGKVALRIYDTAGRLVRTFVDGERSAGRNHSVLWNGMDDQNRRVASGVYFCRLDTPDAHSIRKLVVLR